MKENIEEKVVLEAGIEPARGCPRGILSLDNAMKHSKPQSITSIES